MLAQLTTWKGWGRGLVGAAIGAAANSVVAMYACPKDFNFTPEGLKNLGTLALGSALVGAFQWLKQHPIPEE